MCKCNHNCKNFPPEAKEILREYKDEFGVKHRESVFVCLYDGHRIKSYLDCEHYELKNGG